MGTWEYMDGAPKYLEAQQLDLCGTFTLSIGNVLQSTFSFNTVSAPLGINRHHQGVNSSTWIWKGVSATL